MIGRGTDRLYIFDDCTGVLDARNEPTEKIKEKDTFHRLDALRYAAAGVTTPQGVFFS